MISCGGITLNFNGFPCCISINSFLARFFSTSYILDLGTFDARLISDAVALIRDILAT
jgi:hypothetical protein